jgi:uncharacterized protein YqfA (UPF0365 family)
MKYVPLVAVGLGLWSASCVGSPVPNDKVASSEAAVQRARTSGAGEAPQAGLYLDLAQNELDRGKALIRSGDNDEANAVLQRAEVDADLAVAMARENQTRTAAEQTKARAEALRARIVPQSAVGGGPVSPPAQASPQPSSPQQGK